MAKRKKATGAIDKPKLDGLGQEIDPAGSYYIQDKRQVVGNCALWWAAGSQGYTCELGSAGVFSGTEASAMRETDIPWPVDVVRSHAVTHVRVEPLHRAAAAARGPVLPMSKVPGEAPARG